MHWSSLAASALLVSSAAALQVAVPVLPLPPTGTWGTPVQHNVNAAPGFQNAPPTGSNGQRFKALHLALIPQPAANAGLVIGWDSQGQNGGVGGWFQRWSVVDPSTDPPTVKWNDELFIPGNASGDLFCSGMAWMPDGRLLVVGGTTLYPPPNTPFNGANLALVYDPAPSGLQPFGRWSLLPRMAKNRWYPTVTKDGGGRMIISGGTHMGGGENTYEVFDPATNTWLTNPATGNKWFPGPTNSTGGGLFFNYPRMHVLSEGQLYMSGPHTQSARLDHNAAPGVWTLTGNPSVHRHDGASFLFPLPWNVVDVLMILGGAAPPGHTMPHASSEVSLPQGTPAPWILGPAMIRKRVHLNAVVLPDASVLAFGGNDWNAGTGQPIFWKDVEWLDSSLIWQTLATGASTRDYHSTAMLLPDGKVLSAGGDNRDWDWQLFSPPYFDNPTLARPANVTLNSTNLSYFASGGTTFTANFTLPAGRSISKVVLMAPGSTTHHSDMAQRYIDLPIASQGAGTVTFFPPFNSCVAPNPFNFCAPPGHYMLFLVTDEGVPSNAVFVTI